MKKLYLLLFISFWGCQTSQENKLTIHVKIDDAIANQFINKGRVYLFFNTSARTEPKDMTWPSPTSSSAIFAQNIDQWDQGATLHLNNKSNWTDTESWDLGNVPEGTYYIQVLWDQDIKESTIHVPGNFYSKPKKIEIKDTQEVDLVLSEIIPKRTLTNHPLIQEVTFESDTLSSWWSKPMKIKAAVLLPRGYKEKKDKKYPVRYNIGGYGSRYTRVNRLWQRKGFKEWWLSEDAPEVINIFLDGEGPFGDSYQLDSENSGPYGYALINELIPFLESEFRAIGTSKYRFVDGCSTGGWVSLALQVFYPETFNGCWSFSPDPVDFHHMQLIDLYNEEYAFFDQKNVKRPSMRTTKGDTVFSIQREITYENVQGYSNTYVTSGQQWGGWNALFSPKQKDGLPTPVFDPETGKINNEAVKVWKRYDIHNYLKENWASEGHKLQGKVYVWMGDMDNFYLNNALVVLDNFLKNTENPKSDAQIVIEKGKGHCSDYTHKKVLEMIHAKLKKDTSL